MAIQQATAPSADLYFSRGVSYMALRNYAQAKADFEAALRLRPSFAGAKAKLEEARQASGISHSPPAGQSMYGAFKAVLDRSRLSLAEHPSYTEPFRPRAGWGAPKNRPRLETAIVMTGTSVQCPANQQTADRWLRTNLR